MAIQDQIKLIQNEKLRERLLALEGINPENALTKIKRWRNGTIFLRVLATIFTLGLIPLFYALWPVVSTNGEKVKTENTEPVNWITQPYDETIDAINRIKRTIEIERHVEQAEQDPPHPTGTWGSFEESDSNKDEDEREYELTTSASQHLLGRTPNPKKERPAQIKNELTLENDNTKLVSKVKISEKSSSRYTLLETKEKNTITAFYLNPFTKMLYIATSDNMLHITRTRRLPNNKLLIRNGKTITFRVRHPQIKAKETVTKIVAGSLNKLVVLCFDTQKAILVNTDRSGDIITLGELDAESLDFIKPYEDIWEPIKFFEKLDETRIIHSDQGLTILTNDGEITEANFEQTQREQQANDVVI